MADIRTKGDALRYLVTYVMVGGIIFGLVRLSYAGDVWAWIIIGVGIIGSIIYVAEIKGKVNLGK